MDPQAEIESLKAQTQLLMSQAISDFQRRVRNIASLVMGRLVRSASVSTPAKSALSVYFSRSQKQRQLRQFLTRNRLQSTPQDFARHFDSLEKFICSWFLSQSRNFEPSTCLLQRGSIQQTMRWLNWSQTSNQKPCTPVVQNRGVCDREFVVFNNFATVKTMFL